MNNLISKSSSNASELGTFSFNAFRALDTENKGYLTQEEILQPLQLLGVIDHYLLKNLVKRVREKKMNKFSFIEFDEFIGQTEFLRKVI
jgi:Ca2+-binding EF-hand superfamily protein